MRSDEWRGVKWWRRGTYCCKGCRSRRAGAGREHWGAPSSFPLPVSVALPLSYVFSSSLQLLFALPRFFSLILETQPSSRSEKQEKPFGGKMSEGTPGSNRLTSKRAEEGAKDWGVRLCVWERKQQAGDGHRRPLLGKGRSTHSLSLSLWLALSLPPTPPLSLSWFCVNASSASLAVSLPVSLPPSVLAACRSRNWEAVPNDWSSEVCEMWINWQNLSFSLHKWNH